MEKLKIHYFQHVPFEGLGVIEEWIREKGHYLTSTQFYSDSKLPDADAIDWLIVMGGPMGVYDEAIYPWLRKEKEFIDQAIKKQKVVLGICLGAQLIAEVLGSEVYPNTQKEIGWFPITVNKDVGTNVLFEFLPKKLDVFHWHGDTFDLPEGALHIAESVICKNQAFSYKDRVIGLQFHFEVDEASIRGMVEGADDELVKGAYVQTASEILERINLTTENNVHMKKLLDRLVSP